MVFPGKRIKMDIRSIPRDRFLAAFFLTAFIFVLAILLNNYFNEIRLNRLNSIYNDARIDVMNAEVQYNILSENPCLALNFEPMTNELFELGGKLTTMEDRLGKDNEEVLNLKKYYSILEAKQWLFLKKASKECKINTKPILFFYSNEEDCKNCEQQGFVLSYIRKISKDVYVYSFDANLDTSAIRALKLTYNITDVPSLVVDDNTYMGFMDADDLFEILNMEEHE